MADEEFHEIQLNGKQLVFLFMAGTVAAVVIFLCGLMVGRNLRTPRSDAIATAAGATLADPTRPNEAVPPPPTTAETGAPATTGETLTYPDRLEAPTPPEETLREQDESAPAADPTPAAPKQTAKVQQAPKEKPRTASAAAAPAPAPRPAPTSTSEPAGNGFAVQVAAVRTRSEADAIAGRLKSKGYPAFVTTPGSGAAVFFRVRIGKYTERREADAVATKLQKEEQFKPWITR